MNSVEARAAVSVSTSSVEARVKERLDAIVAETTAGSSGSVPAHVVRGLAAGAASAGVVSLFSRSPESGPRDGFGQHDGPVRHLVSEGTTTTPEEVIVEFRSSVDARPRLDTSSAATSLDWFREHLGTPALPGFYARDGMLVRVTREESVGDLVKRRDSAADSDESEEDADAAALLEAPAVRRMQPVPFLAVVQEHLWPYSEKVDIEKDSSGRPVKITRTRTHRLLDLTVCRSVIEGVQEWPKVPRVTGVSHTPTLRANGSVVSTPGYDSKSGVLYLPDAALDVPDVATSTTTESLAWAREQLLYVLADFPFEDEEFRANMLALLLTPLMRRVVEPPYPMFLLNAHQRGSGKSYLASIASTLHGGVHRPDLTGDDEEIRKQITSILVGTTAPIVNFDNVTTVIRSGNIANLLTSKVWTDRPLGQTASVECTNDRIWIATGNNIRVGGDLARRTLYVNLDAGVARPELRSGFRITNLSEYVKENRGNLLAALLVVLGVWVERGCPGRSGVPTPERLAAGGAVVRTDDYGRWACSMQEILEGAGLVSPGVFTAGVSSVAGALVSDDESELAMLVDALVDTFGGDEFQVRQIRDKLEDDAMYGKRDLDDALPGSVKNARDTWKSLGRYLLKHERTFTESGLRLRKTREARGGTCWVVERSSV